VKGERPGVWLALTPLAERACEAWFFGEHPTFTPLGSVSEADELDRLALGGDAVALLLSPGLSGLTAGHCERSRARGLRLVGVALDERDRELLHRLGVDTVISPDEDAQRLTEIVRADHRVIQLAAQPREPRTEQRRDGDGTAVAVIGARGAPGASELAASLAALANRRWPTVLVELDALGGGLCVRLGTDAHEGSVLGLIRAATTGEPIVPELLERWLTTRPGWPAVLVNPPDLRAVAEELACPGAVAAALASLRRVAQLSVWDVGFLLDTGGEIPAAARAHREAVVSADAVVLVLGAREGHVSTGLAQLDVLVGPLGVPTDRLRVVVNGIGGPGAMAEQALNETLVPKLSERGLSADVWLAWDGRALGHATRRGLPLAAARARGPYRRVLSHLLDELFLPSTTKLKQRKRRLAAPVKQPRPEVEEVALPWRS
jgi:Flp pilus assembly CpaE family ATPase